MASDPTPAGAPPGGDAAENDAILTPASLLGRAHIRSESASSEFGSDADKATPQGPEAKLTEMSDRAKLHNDGLEQFYEMRLRWSRWLIGWVTSLIVFQILLTVAIGTGALNFGAHQTFLDMTVGQNFVQVVAMAIIVVRFLHSHGKDDPPL